MRKFAETALVLVLGAAVGYALFALLAGLFYLALLIVTGGGGNR